MLPPFDALGNLPEGIHTIDVEGFFARFGGGSAQRTWLAARLREILTLAASVGGLERVFVWGSYVTEKDRPNDLDLLFLFGIDFSIETVPPPSMVLFDHQRARVRFQADLFWSTSAIGDEILKDWLDAYQTARDLRRRGIVEIILG